MMENFIYKNPVKIIFGKNQIKNNLKTEISKYKKIMFLYGGGSIKTNGIYNQVVEIIGNQDFIEFSGIEANPKYETLIKAVDIAIKEKVDFLLAVGGGSVLDGVKFIAAAVKYRGDDHWNILKNNVKIEDALPIGTILTLPATGSEMNGNFVISRISSKEKLSNSSIYCMPVFSILDPQVMFSLPDRQISNGIVDAFIHVIEQYLTFNTESPVQDRFAESILITLIEEGPKILNNRQNYTANSNLMWAATMALNGLIGLGVPQDWSTHRIGHEITAFTGLDHAKTLAIVLPGVMNRMRDEKQDKIIQLGKRVFNINLEKKDEAINETIKQVEQFFNSVNINTKLSDYKIDKDIIDKIYQRFVERNIILGENQSISPEIIKQILLLRI